MEFDDIGEPLTCFQEHYPDTIPDLFASENDHMPSQSFSTDFYVSFRQEAIPLIFQVILIYRACALFLVFHFLEINFILLLIRHSFPATLTLLYPTLL